MKKGKITITGDLGSGKTVVSKLLSDKTGVPITSTGDIQRKMAKSMGLTTFELNELADNDKSIDAKIDAASKALNNDEDPYIVDSRMSWHFIDKALKVYLKVNPHIAAKRILNDQNRSSESYSSKDQAFDLLQSRRKTEIDRFISKYGVDYTNLNQYDLVVVTDNLTPQVVSEIIVNIYNDPSNDQKKIMTSPKSLIPLQHVRSITNENIKNIRSNMLSHGFDVDQPVSVIESDGYLYIYDGHKRTSSAIFEGIEVIAIQVIAKGPEEIFPGMSADKYASTNYNKSWVYDWENILNFRFKEYPTI